jgi:hypothetical protein
METLHKLQHPVLLGGLFALGMFLFANASALIRLEPLDLRKRSVYVVCLIGGLLFGLLMEFGYLIPHHTIVVPLLCVLSIWVGIVIRHWRNREPRGKSDR